MSRYQYLKTRVTFKLFDVSIFNFKLLQIRMFLIRTQCTAFRSYPDLDNRSKNPLQWEMISLGNFLLELKRCIKQSWNVIYKCDFNGMWQLGLTLFLYIWPPSNSTSSICCWSNFLILLLKKSFFPPRNFQIVLKKQFFFLTIPKNQHSAEITINYIQIIDY